MQGGKLAYGSTRRTGKDVDLWVDQSSGAEDPTTWWRKLEGGGWDATRLVARWPQDSRARGDLRERELPLGGRRRERREESCSRPKGGEKISYAGGRFSKDGKGIYTTTDKDSEFHRLAYIDLGNLQHTYLQQLRFPGTWRSSISPTMARRSPSSRNEDGFGVLHIYDVASKTREAGYEPSARR